MTPADEIEYVIRKISMHEKNDIPISYKITSFPEITLIKLPSYCTVEILKEYRQNDDVNKKTEELRKELGTRKITIKNQIVYTDRKIVIRGDSVFEVIPIYYKDCIFTNPHTLIGTNSVNCIVKRR